MSISPSKILFWAALVYIAWVFVWSVFLRQPDGAFKELKPSYGKRIDFVGHVVRDPVVRTKNVQLTLALENLKGKLLVTTDTSFAFEYGDVVRVQGKLTEPPVFEDFNYKNYLEAKGVYGIMLISEIELLQRGVYGNIAQTLFAKILSIKHRLREVLHANIPAPHSTFLGALLLGDQSTLSEAWKEKLNATGLRHIIAISGQHVAILTSMLTAFFLGIGFWRKQAFLGAFLCMVFFILITGMEASAVRAGIMGTVLLLGQYMGRMRSACRALAFAAALMLLDNPLLLTRDVGFQLSFVAVGGIIFSFPFFKYVLRKIPQTLGLQDMMAMNFAAQFFTLPLLIYNFGYVSLISVLTNILILPFIPFLIGMGLVFLTAGALWSMLGFLLAFPVFLFASYFVFVTDIFSAFPFVSLSIDNISPLWVILLYIPMIFFIRKFQKEQSGDMIGTL